MKFLGILSDVEALSWRNLSLLYDFDKRDNTFRHNLPSHVSDLRESQRNSILSFTCCITSWRLQLIWTVPPNMCCVVSGPIRECNGAGDLSWQSSEPECDAWLGWLRVGHGWFYKLVQPVTVRPHPSHARAHVVYTWKCGNHVCVPLWFLSLSDKSDSSIYILQLSIKMW